MATGLEFRRVLFRSLGLVPGGGGRAHEDLIATASCAVVDVPVVATSRFEAHVADRDAPCDERGQITPSDEVLREGLVGIAEREGLLELVLRSQREIGRAHV